MGNIVLHSFNGGEMSPKIDTRADTAKYKAGCRILENMIPLTYGCAERRPGTEYIATAKLSPLGVRMVPFIYNSDIAYEIEFGDEYCRFFYDGELITGADIETPYQVEDLPELQFHQIGDVMWIVHRLYAPRKLTRTTATTFSLDVIVFEQGPFLTRNDIENDDGVTMELKDVYAVGDAGTIKASADVFENEHVGALFELTHPRDDVTVDVSGDGDHNSDWVVVDGEATFTTHGDWSGTVKLQRSHDGGTTIDDYRVYKASKDRNVQLTWTEDEDNISYRISATGIDHDEHSFGAEIQPHETLHRSVFRVDAVNTSTQVADVTCMVAAPAVNGLVATKRWAEGAWSMVRGYPSAVGAKDGRIWYGGTNHQPATIWASKVEDYEYFEAGVNDDDSFSRTLTTHNEIVWISTLDGLVVGTTGGVWVGRPSKLDTAIKPTDFTIKEYVTFGSAKIQAIKVDNVILYVDESKREVREFTYGQSDAEYVAPDMTVLAEHITSGLIAAMAFQKNPDPILWVCCEDGQLLSMTYDRTQEVVAWAKHPMGNIQGSYMVYPTLRAANEMPEIVAPDPIAEIELSGETEVSTADGLQAITGAGHYKLTADIDLTGYNWVPIANFSGVLDGQSHRIFGLKLQNHTGTNQALFRNLSTNAQVRHIILEDCSVSGGWISNSYVSGTTAVLCAYVHNATNVLIKNITVANCNIGPNPATTESLDTSAFILAYLQNASVDIYDCTVLNSVIDGADPYGEHSWDIGGIVGDVYIGGVDSIANAVASDHTVRIVRNKVKGLRLVRASQSGGIAGAIDVFQNSSTYKRADRNRVYVMDCEADVDIEGYMFCGGLIGSFYIGRGLYSRDNVGIVSNCTATGTIHTAADDVQFLGGCISDISSGNSSTKAWNSVTISACTSSVNITVLSDDGIQYIGGFSAYMSCAAQCSLRVYDSVASGNVTANSKSDYSIFIGGFCGHFEGNPVITTYEETGGTSSIVIYNCHATGNITASSIEDTGVIGGFVGFSEYTAFAYCHSTGNLFLRSDALNYWGYMYEIGGFSGYLGDSTSVYACYSTSNVSAVSVAGQVLYSDWLGERTKYCSEILDVGGFSGTNSDEGVRISDCYAWGNVACETSHVVTEQIEITRGEVYNIGGFVGNLYYNAKMENVYAIGRVAVSTDLDYINKNSKSTAGAGTIHNVGALVGENNGSVSRSYFDYEESGSKTSDGGTALTTVLAKTKSSYVLWDFDFVWKMQEFGAISVCVTPTTGEDRVTLATSRIVQGAQVRYIERMALRNFEEQKDCFFVDCGKTQTGSTSSSIAGLEHLEGEKVKVLGDGAYVGEFTVTQGTVNLPDAFYTIHVGLPYTYQLKPNRLDDENTRDMTRMIHKITVSLLKSLNVKYGRTFDALHNIDFRVDEPYTMPPALFTGDKEVSFDGGFAVDDPILIAGNDPMPCTVRALVVKMNTTSR